MDSLWAKPTVTVLTSGDFTSIEVIPTVTVLTSPTAAVLLKSTVVLFKETVTVNGC